MRIPALVSTGGLCCLLFHASAFAVAEKEPNDKECGFQEEGCYPLQVTQQVSLTAGKVSITGELEDRFPYDVDFYSFDAEPNESYTIAIENGAGGLDPFFAHIAVFGPGPDHVRERKADYADGQDPVIENFVAAEAATYTVGVSQFGLTFYEYGKGTVTPNGVETGDYTLTITHNRPEELPVPIEIRPGNLKASWVGMRGTSGDDDTSEAEASEGKGKSKVNAKRNGTVRVAIKATTRGFAAEDVDAHTVTFGPTGEERSVKRCMLDDINGDKRDDLVCEVDMSKTGFSSRAAEGVLKGRLHDGTIIRGQNTLAPGQSIR